MNAMFARAICLSSAVALLAIADGASAQAPVKIGLIGEFTGPFADYGTQIYNGIKAYLKRREEPTFETELEQLHLFRIRGRAHALAVDDPSLQDLLHHRARDRPRGTRWEDRLGAPARRCHDLRTVAVEQHDADPVERDQRADAHSTRRCQEVTGGAA